MGRRTDSLAGTLELLILKTLQRGPNHGFGITMHILQASEGLVGVEEGSLYPALHRLEKDHVIQGEWQVTENSRRARVYSLTRQGRARLENAEARWNDLSQGVQKVLRFA
jgi:PadR family transcriptional regulator, regulatory protein PadR